jgi:hypothetical protein
MEAGEHVLGSLGARESHRLMGSRNQPVAACAIRQCVAQVRIAFGPLLSSPCSYSMLSNLLLSHVSAVVAGINLP